MSRVVVVLLAVASLLAGAPVLQAQVVDRDDPDWQKLETAGLAQQLYMNGEQAYKRNDFKTAVRCWAKALELKPESDYTKKQLATARAKLYKNYISYAAKKDPTKDLITATVVLSELVTLLPDKLDLSDKLLRCQNKMAPNQTKALELYDQAITLAGQRDYVKSREAISQAENLDPHAACIREFSVKLASMLRSKYGTIGVATANLPLMVYLGADWCPYCRQMKPVLEKLKSAYAGKMELLHIDTEAQKEIAQTYGYHSIPTMVFIKNGQEIKRTSGARTFEEMQQLLAEVGIQ